MIPLRSGNGVPFHSKRERVKVEVTLHKYFFVQRLRERSMTTRPEEAFNLSPLYCILQYIYMIYDKVYFFLVDLVKIFVPSRKN